METKNKNNKNYYIEDNIGNSGVGTIKNPLYLSEDYSPFEISPRNRNIGQYFDTDSKYDEYLGDVEKAIESDLTVSDLRANHQSNLERMGNALVNNLVIMGTSAISGTLGLAEGILSTAYNESIDKLWDNNINNWAVDVQNNFREKFPIYRGQEYENKNVFKKLGTGIFWADVLQNLGYTEGMLIPGMGVSALVSKAPKAARMLVPSIVSAIGEGSTEAVNAKNDEIENKLKLANQRFNSLYSITESPIMKKILEDEYKNVVSDIQEDAVKAGNFVLASNIALLTLTNTLEFGKLFSRGFGTSQRMANVYKKLKPGIKHTEDGLYKASSVSNEILKATGKKTLDALSEGFEEVAQGIISETPSLTEDFNQFNKSTFNPEYRQLASNLMQGMGISLSEAMNDPKTAEEFASGFVIGILGVPMLKKSKLPIQLENGIYSEVKEAVDKARENNRIVDNINSRLSEDDKIKSYYDGLVRHLVMQDKMNTSLEKNNILDYKSAESAQFISDAMMFDEIGDLDKLSDIINNSVDLSDEGIKSIIEETSKNGEGPFMYNGNPLSVEEVRRLITDKIGILNEKLDNYIQNKKELQSYIPTLNNSALKISLFLKGQIHDYNSRIQTLAEEGTSIINKLIKEDYLKNNKKTSKKVSKKQGVYITQGIQKILVDKSSIEYIDENGYPVFKNKKDEEDTIPLISNKEEFLKRFFNDDDFVNHIYTMLNSKSSTVPYDEKKRLYNIIGDIPKLNYALLTYNKNLTDILINPNKAEELDEKNIKEAEENYKKAKIENWKNIILSGLSTNSLKSTIENFEDTEFLEDAFEELESELNDSDKKILEEYKEVKKFKEDIDSILDTLDYSDEKKSITAFIDSNFKKLNNAEDILKRLKNPRRLNAETKKLLNDILDQYQKNKESREASERDKNKAKKKIKSKKRKFSLSDASDSIDEMDAGDMDNIQKSSEDSDSENVEENSSKKVNKQKNKSEEKEIEDEDKDETENEDEDEDGIDKEDSNENESDSEEGQKKDTSEIKPDKKPKRTLEEKMENLSEEDLENLISGKVIIKGTSEEDIPVIKELAKAILEYKRTPKYEDDSNTNEEEIEKEEEKKDNEEVEQKEPKDSNSLRSWYHTKYNFFNLKDSKIRNATIYDSPVTKALDELDAYDFVDKGNLGILFNEDENIPIHYVKVKDERLNDVIVLAIEVTEEVSKLVNTPKSFIAQDGKRYQAVGALGFNKDSKSSETSYFKLQDLINESYEDYLKSNNNIEQSNLNYYVYPEKTNKIKHIYSGRIIKSFNNSGVEQRPLVDIAGETPDLGVYYKRRLRTPTISEEEEIVSLNINNTNSKEGSVWVLSKEADGRYYPKHVKVKRFTKEEYDYEEHKDTPLMKELLDNIKVFVSTEYSDKERSLAKYEIMNILYFPNKNKLLFNGDIISIAEYKNNIGKNLNNEEKAYALLEALQSEELNLRFQISPSKFIEESYLKDIMHSDILTTDLYQLNNVNASFDLYTVDSKGNIIDTKEGFKKGHTGKSNIKSTSERITLTLNSTTYYILSSDGKITSVTDENNKKKISKKLIEELEFMIKIREGSVNPIKGSDDLYIGYYSDGTEFGILNGKIKKGKSLEILKDKAEKNNKKMDREEFIEKYFESADEELKKNGLPLNYTTIKKEDINAEEKENTDEEKEIEEKDNDSDLLEGASPEDIEKLNEKLNKLEKDFKKDSEKEKDEEGNGNDGLDLNDMFENTGSEDLIKKLNALEKKKESEEENNISVKKKAESDIGESNKKVVEVIGEEFVAIKHKSAKDLTLNSKNPTFQTFIRKNLKAVGELGFKNIQEFIDYVNDPKNKLPSIETITDNDKFNSLLNLIKSCRN